MIKFLKKNFFYKTKITPYGKPIIDCPLENEEKLENFKELLNISLNLEICIILLIFYTLLILIFTNLAKKELKLNWTSKIPFGNKIRSIILFLQKSWGNLNIIYLYITIILSLIFSLINAGFIQVLIYAITNI